MYVFIDNRDLGERLLVVMDYAADGPWVPMFIHRGRGEDTVILHRFVVENAGLIRRLVPRIVNSQDWGISIYMAPRTRDGEFRWYGGLDLRGSPRMRGVARWADEMVVDGQEYTLMPEDF